MQIDWISGFVETPPSLWPGYESGRTLKLDQHGDIIENRVSASQIRDADPSSSRSYRVWTPSPGQLFISGNPCKLLQGHNLWGCLDARGYYFEGGAWVRQHAGLFPGASTWEGCRFAGPRYTRIDITRSYRFASEAVASEFIEFVLGTARTRHGAANLYGSQTAYFGKNSNRWAMKGYRKFPEMDRQRSKLKKIREKLGFADELMDWCRGVVRFELVLRRKEIVTNYPDADLNDGATLARIWAEKFDTIQFNENANMSKNRDLLESQLPAAQQGALAMWRQGMDVRDVYSNATFYRYRKALLRTIGVDIRSPAPPQRKRAEPLPSVLDESLWDPEPIGQGIVLPRESVKADYRQRELPLDEPA